MPRINHILCLLSLAFTAYAQVDITNCSYNGSTYIYNNNSVQLSCVTYDCGTVSAFDCQYAGSNYSEDCNYDYSQLRMSGNSLYNYTYYTCPQDTFPSPIGFGSPVTDSSDPSVSNCTNLGWMSQPQSNYSCLQYQCNMDNGTTYYRSECVSNNYSCTYFTNITNNYTCSPFSITSTCLYSNTTISDGGDSCMNFNCAFDNGTQFTTSSCSYANTTTDGCTYLNSTYYPNNYMCSLYNCSFSNGTQYYKDDNCYYFGSNYTQDCTYINTNAQYLPSVQPMTQVCFNYNCLNNDTNTTTSQNCTYVSSVDNSNCNYINATTETLSEDQVTAIFTCDNYQCTLNGDSYVFPSCTLTDPVCITSNTINTSFICQTIECQFSNGTIYAIPNQNCLGVSCVVLNSTNNGTYTCTNYNCSGSSVVTSNCEPNTPTDQQVCTFLNITTNSTYNCTNYNCTFGNTFSIVSNCQELGGTNPNNGNTGNTGNSGNTGNTGNTNTGSNGNTGNSGNTGNTGGTNNQGTGGSQTDSGAGTTSQVSDSSNSSSSSSSTWIIVGCILGVAVIAVGGFVWYKFRLAKRAAHKEAGLSTELGTTGFSSNVTQLRVAL